MWGVFFADLLAYNPPNIMAILYQTGIYIKGLAPVVQRLDNAIHWINRYPVDKCSQNKPRYPPDSDLSGG